MTTDEIVQALIRGEDVPIPVGQVGAVKRRLRRIKENCTITLSRLKSKLG